MQRTAQAVTEETGLWVWFVLFITMYLLLSFVTILVLRFFFRRRPLRDELERIAKNI